MHRNYSRVASKPTNKTVRRTSYLKTKEHQNGCLMNKRSAKRAIMNECRM